jgi:hypothetical protein
MISALIPSLFIAAHLFSSPAKVAETPELENSGILVSEWESIPSWEIQVNGSEKTYVYNRPTPQLDKEILDGGAVLVFVKGYDFEGWSRSVSKPVSLPFISGLLNENIHHFYEWNFAGDEGAVSVSLNMHSDLEKIFNEKKGELRFRYLILSPEFLQKNSLSKQELRKMSYSELQRKMQTTAPGIVMN